MINFPFKNSILSSLIKQRMTNLNKMKENPIYFQEKVFSFLIKYARNTKFGIDHSFEKIKNYNDYKELVPSRKYEEIFSYIKETRRGKTMVDIG